jgi:hypothetical protein
MAAMNWDEARKVLVTLTEDLRPSPTTSSDALLAARKDIAIAIVTGQELSSFGTRLLYDPSRITLPVSQWPQYDNAKPTGTPTDTPRALRRTLGLPFPLVEGRGNLDTTLGLKPNVKHGPFLDAFDRPVYIDVFKPIRGQEYAFPGQEANAYMYIAAPINPTGRFEASLGAGTVWIRASIFTGSNSESTRAPYNSFFGLRIVSGSMTNPPIAPAPRTLSLKLDGSPSASTNFAMNPVTDVSFAFAWPTTPTSTTTATISTIGSGQVMALGSTFKMQQGPNNAVFDHLLGRLNFAMAVDPSTFKPGQDVSGLLDTNGESPVAMAAWSVIAKTPYQKTFYEAPGPGGFSISLQPGIKVQVKGETTPVALGNCSVVTEPESLVMAGTTARAPMTPSSVTMGGVELAGKENKGSSLTFRPGLDTPFYYEARLDGIESWTVNADLSFALDQPRTVNNERVPFESRTRSENRWNTLTWSRDPQFGGMTLSVQALNELPRTRVSYALKNLLVKADPPASIEMAGVYKVGTMVSGRVRMTSFLRYTLPFLPDPYASNFEMTIDPAVEKNGLGYITTSAQWDAQTLQNLDLTIMTIFVTLAKTIERSNSGNRRDDPVFGEIMSGRRQYWRQGVYEQELGNGLIPDRGLGRNFHFPDTPLTRGGYFHPPTLLDVSSSGSQFGIVFSTGTYFPAVLTESMEWVTTDTLQEFQVSELMLKSTTENVRVMTLPAIQWEPVTEADISTVPASLTQVYRFPYSGPSTQMALSAENTTSVRLVPTAPKEAVDGLVGTYNSGNPATVATRFSLPFGMVAVAKVENRGFVRAAKVRKIHFTLSGEQDPKTKLKPPELQPSHQLSFQPPAPRRFVPRPPAGQRRLLGSSDPSFPGITTLLQMNVRQNGDLIDPNSITFLDNMADKVPLHRFDISGYGASIFSDWRRVLGPGDPDIAITKVLINVMNGRTSREVIKLQSVKAPFAVTVTKTVEIKRLNSGVVIRHESDWDPTSVGRYFYKNAEIVTHIGVIRGVIDVRNIRETSGTITVPDTQVQVRRVKFDCVAEIEDGGEIRSVPARDLNGCIFLDSKDLDKPEAAQTYAKVLEKLDLGGQVDFIMNIGTSGQKKRITSLSVKPGLDPASQKQVAVAAAWGAPVFQGGGQWSFAKMSGDRQPHPVDMAKGVPLVREGRHDALNLASRVTSYLFRDPEELLLPNPFAEYGIVHGAASHRVMFTSPEIPFVQDVKKGILSKKVLVADSLALGKSTGIFPKLDDCLPVQTALPPLPTPSQLLEIVEGGYAFEPKKLIDESIQLELPALSRVLKTDASVNTVVETINSTQKDLNSTLNLAINTAKSISKMDITNINMVTSTVSTATETAKEASRVIGRLSSDVSKVGGLLGRDIDVPDPEDLFQAPLHKFGEALVQVQKVISFLESLKFLPNFKVSMTNEWAMVMSTSMNREDLLKKIPAPSRPPVERIIESFDFLLSSRTSLSSFLLKMHVGTTISIPTGFGPIVAIGKGAFDVALGTTGVEVKLELGCGIGVAFSVGPFSASASYTQSQTIIFDEDHWGVGITACMRAHLDLVIASADLYLEAKLLVVGGECLDHATAQPPHQETTIWGFAQVRIAVHVSIFLVCNISVDEEAQWENNFNGGPCQLDRMGDLIR